MAGVNLQNSNSEAIENIMREHDALRHKIHAIHSVLADHNPNPTEVETLLREFLSALMVHFANEEGDEFFGEMRAKAPARAAVAGRLCTEHRELLHEAEELCRFASCGAPSIPWWRELANRCSTFNQRLMVHEHEENELLRESNRAKAAGVAAVK